MIFFGTTMRFSTLPGSSSSGAGPLPLFPPKYGQQSKHGNWNVPSKTILRPKRVEPFFPYQLAFVPSRTDEKGKDEVIDELVTTIQKLMR